MKIYYRRLSDAVTYFEEWELCTWRVWETYKDWGRWNEEAGDNIV
jgi:hypothetical protein